MDNKEEKLNVKVTETSAAVDENFSDSTGFKNSKATHDGGSKLEVNNPTIQNKNSFSTDDLTDANSVNTKDPSSINLSKSNSDIDLSDSGSPERRARRRKAFSTIRTYLEKNRSKVTEKDKSIEDTIKDENTVKNKNDDNANANRNDTVNINLEINKAFQNDDELSFSKERKIEIKEPESSQSFVTSKDSESEFGTDIITLGGKALNNADNTPPTETPIDDSQYNSKNKAVVFQASPAAMNNQTKMVSLYVGDLDESVTENDLYIYFSKFDGLISVKIPMDTNHNKSLRYGYVNFNTQQNADIATDGLSYTKLKGSEIRIMPSVRDKQQRETLGTNLFFSNLDHTLSSRIMYDRFKSFSKILSCKYSAEKGTCFINFSEKLGALKICSQFNQTEMDGKVINVSIHIPKKERDLYQTNNKFSKLLDMISKKQGTVVSPVEPAEKNVLFSIDKTKAEQSQAPSTQYSVFIKNLPINIKEEIVKNLVEPFGTVKDVLKRDVPDKNGAWALVTMTNQNAVDKTIQNLNSIEVEDKRLFVTRAIPREEKDYAKRDEKYPKKRYKLLISEIDLEKEKERLEEWCSNCDSIKTAEFFSTAPKGEISKSNKYNGYGYIELNDDNQADDLVRRFKNLGISCYKIKIEISSKEKNMDTKRYPYYFNNSSSTRNRLPHKIATFSYVDPVKMYEIATFQNAVNSDKLAYFQSLENFNKVKLREKSALDDTNQNLLEERKSEMYHVMWDLCIRLFFPKPELYIRPANELLSIPQISSLTDLIIKFCWNNNFNEFYNFVKKNQFDDDNNIIHVANPILEYQITQTAKYLKII